MNKTQKNIVRASIIFCALAAIAPETKAMHIMEGYLPGRYCIAWGIICIPFLLIGFFNMKRRTEGERGAMVLLAMSGAFIFVISSLKIPSVTGSCSHMTGTGLAAILFGPFAVSILGVIVLLFQALLLAHGGITTLGANTFSMAIAGPILSYAVYAICRKCKIRPLVSAFLAAMFGDLFTYFVTSIQLAIAYPSEQGGIASSAVKFLGIFAPTQLPLAVLEGILTVLILIALETYARKELRSIGFLKGVK